MSVLLTKVCRTCREEKPLARFTPEKRYEDGHDSRCRDCENGRKAQLRASRSTPTHPCARCGRKIRRYRMCFPCRDMLRGEKELALQEAPLSPGVCGLPMRGKRCLIAVQDGTDHLGRATLYCDVHGERYAPVIRPKSFVRYDQRDRLMAELVQGQVRACTAVDPEVSARVQRVQQDFHVVGRALADRIHAA